MPSTVMMNVERIQPHAQRASMTEEARRQVGSPRTVKRRMDVILHAQANAP